MRPQKALELLKDVRAGYINDRCYEDINEDVEAIDYAMSLVEKEIAESNSHKFDPQYQTNWFDRYSIVGIDENA